MGQQLEEAQTQLQAETQLRQEFQQAQQQLRRFLQLAENQQAQAQLRQQLEEHRATAGAEGELPGRADQAGSADQGIAGGPGGGGAEGQASLTEALAEETKRREGAEQQAGEIGQRRSELEAELAENKQAQARLRQQLEEVQRQLQALKENYIAERSRLEARMKELQAAQAPAGAEGQASLTETLADETKRPGGAEQQGGEVAEQSNRAGRRGALNAVREFVEDKVRLLMKAKPREDVEQEAAENAEHRRGLEASQKELQAHQESSGAQQTRLAGLSQELQAAQADVLRRVKRLTETLAEETRRREGALQQAGEIGQRRSELEAQLARQQAKHSCGKSWKRRRSNCRHNRRAPAPNRPSWKHGSRNCSRRRRRWSSRSSG